MKLSNFIAFAALFALPIYSQSHLSTDDTKINIFEIGSANNKLLLDVRIQNTIPLATVHIILKVNKNIITGVKSNPIPDISPSMHNAILKSDTIEHDFLHFIFAYFNAVDSRIVEGDLLPISTDWFTLWTIELSLAENTDKLVVLETVAQVSDSTSGGSYVDAYYEGSNLTSTDQYMSSMPDNAALCQNYPNPFNAGTTINFFLPGKTFIKLDLFNSNGQFLQTLAQGFYPLGNHYVEFERSTLPSGIYFYRLQCGPENNRIHYNSTNKMVITK